MHDTMSYSSATEILSCPRKYQYRKEMQLTMTGDDGSSPSSSYGTLWHMFHEVAANTGVDDVDRYPDDIVHIAMDKLEWRDPPDDYRTADKAIHAFDLWHEFWGNKYWHVEHPEMTFETTDEEHRTGRIDAIVETDEGTGSGNELWVCDYKTTSRLTSNLYELYMLSDQFPLYVMEARALYPEIVGAVVDLYVCTKGNKKGKTKYETSGNRFFRFFYRYDSERVKEAHETITDAIALRNHYRERGRFPKNTSHCNAYNKLCVYADLCGADKKVRAHLIAQVEAMNA